jgi:hypothetical protein
MPVQIIEEFDALDGWDVRCLVTDEQGNELRTYHFAAGRPADTLAAVTALLAAEQAAQPAISVEAEDGTIV